FPGMVYRVINPNLAQADAAYPMVVGAVVPTGLRGLVAAAIVGAIMSTISGLVNSTSTLVTLDTVQRGGGKNWPEKRLVSIGRWSGAIALLIGALIAPLVMKWENLFRYAQDLWTPMAGPVVVVFLAGALWEKASKKGALLCISLSILMIPFVMTKMLLADKGIDILPENLANPLVFAGSITLCAITLMFFCSISLSSIARFLFTGVFMILIFSLAAVNSKIIAAGVLIILTLLIVGLAGTRRLAADHMWDASMLKSDSDHRGWYANLWAWWILTALVMSSIYIYFW
ncbi:MAG: sodium:solute symporter family transporter, partial [Candidatus Hinthialibacter sp.]